ncbi:hypothetical protein BC628DRAFT_1339275 [Trametes gibbosa]|nr:hypothetical protein BC628DRAFT_1339275 [Trametes gibbosa]
MFAAKRVFAFVFLATWGEGVEHPLSKRADASVEDSAIAYVQSCAGVDKVRQKKLAATPSVQVEDAIFSAEKLLSGTHDAENFPSPTIEWFAKEDGSITLTHVFQVRNEDAGTWHEAFVDAHAGDLVSVTYFVNKVSDVPCSPDVQGDLGAGLPDPRRSPRHDRVPPGLTQ